MTDGDRTRRGRWWEVVSVFLKLGALSYGGPAIMGAMEAEVQRRRQWVSKERFVEGLALVNLLPGPLAAQLSIFLGYSRLGWWGGVLAGLAFVVPAFFVMLALTVIYSRYGTIPVMRGIFYGLSPVVVGVFGVAIYRLGRGAVKDAKQVVIAIASAALVALTPFGIIPTLIVAGAVGVALYGSPRCGVAIAALAAVVFGGRFWIGAWLPAPALMSAAFDPSSSAPAPELWNLAAFFLKVGAFTFGGGLAILAFVQDQVVNQLGWLTAREFIDGLALGQLTPGPVVMLAAFVGYRVAGLWGAVVSGIAIFLPSFVLVLSTIPVLDRVKRIAGTRAALRGIGPAVIGMIAVTLVRMVPSAVLDVPTALLSVLTVLAIVVWRLSPLPLIATGGVLGAVLRAR